MMAPRLKFMRVRRRRRATVTRPAVQVARSVAESIVWAWAHWESVGPNAAWAWWLVWRGINVRLVVERGKDN
jgi:hypothetical protein